MRGTAGDLGVPRCERRRACLFHCIVTTELHFVWPPIDFNEDSSRLEYDTVLTSKCDVVCFGKIVNYWRFMTCTPHHAWFECSKQEDRDGQVMQHLWRKGEVYRILVGKLEGKRPLGRPMFRWEKNIKTDLQ